MSIKDEYVYIEIIVFRLVLVLIDWNKNYIIDFREKLYLLFCGRNKAALRCLTFNTEYGNLISQRHM